MAANQITKIPVTPVFLARKRSIAMPPSRLGPSARRTALRSVSSNRGL